ncbi:hypothetical protein EHI8A_055330 [Entamoeba histolytica HM-1:IMSS-B]|uniref:Uncharacterized protein n=6 Tax=Entamoeba histolytica TaxID=5759 RepID=C4MA81_ENTH1|nr:hypothetical protein EHI_067230 [Entamoeba histolytica HM-1:IMSS]EMD48239.1 Hypothetical protein EHI5A_078800 [Entamoeba histolytica KU27]EMH75534.1 hypothetical protein EHI8A_055330 [Entamoeba histolytica HM-1:IMSS-B]EMS11088.1 hypothetical protein KM1_095860 [Entamoeba histolytica HM-3:IMSS]ENY62853.1 hypothetical protein EHI7A_048810 [Entamoeba histolytica HM-1:IMSS-A]GAT98672.1 hypothetical protein CL6EHI_067230 [Entamoeba histolytica]|eukprot:XP_652659.2 hypothetical protein EHI_067230 [Entamoeba histolytica HM-1:IMSS]
MNGLVFLLLLYTNGRINFKLINGKYEIDYIIIKDKIYTEDLLYLNGLNYIKKEFGSSSKISKIYLIRRVYVVMGLIDLLDSFNFKCEIFPKFSLEGITLYDIYSIETPSQEIITTEILWNLGRELLNHIV